MILHDLTQHRRAQQALSQSLAVARSSWREADTLRNATLALTGDPRMDIALRSLLEALAPFAPYEHAQVFLLEPSLRLFLAGQSGSQGEPVPDLGFPETLELSDFPVLESLLENQDGRVIEDASQELGWRPAVTLARVRSWIGVPIISSGRVLGVISLAHSVPGHFSGDHLRLTRSVATTAAIAIQNARLYERAEIYATELQRRDRKTGYAN
jgi:sigma-B regulation protein RsbU (phosphoserine phosphatase)